MSWLAKLFGGGEVDRRKRFDEDDLLGLAKRRQEAKQAGQVRGVHFTDQIERIKELKREQRFDEVEALLLEIIDATERESRVGGGGVAPAYYEQLAIMYRKQKRFDEEVSVLERYAMQTKAPGVGPVKLAERLEKARALRDRMVQ